MLLNNLRLVNIRGTIFFFLFLDAVLLRVMHYFLVSILLVTDLTFFALFLNNLWLSLHLLFLRTLILLFYRSLLLQILQIRSVLKRFGAGSLILIFLKTSITFKEIYFNASIKSSFATEINLSEINWRFFTEILHHFNRFEGCSNVQQASTVAVESFQISACTLHHINTVNYIIFIRWINPKERSVIVAITSFRTVLWFASCRLIDQVRNFTDQILKSSCVATIQGSSNGISIVFSYWIIPVIEKESLIQL